VSPIAVFLDLKSALAADFSILVTRAGVRRAHELSSSQTNLACLSLSCTCLEKRSLKNTTATATRTSPNKRRDQQTNWLLCTFLSRGDIHAKGWECSSYRVLGVTDICLFMMIEFRTKRHYVLVSVLLGWFIHNTVMSRHVLFRPFSDLHFPMRSPCKNFTQATPPLSAGFYISQPSFTYQKREMTIWNCERFRSLLSSGKNFILADILNSQDNCKFWIKIHFVIKNDK